MNESLRWKLVLGCLMLAALEAPRTSLVLLEDLGGPYAHDLERTLEVEHGKVALPIDVVDVADLRAVRNAETELARDGELHGRASR